MWQSAKAYRYPQQIPLKILNSDNNFEVIMSIINISRDMCNDCKGIRCKIPNHPTDDDYCQGIKSG